MLDLVIVGGQKCGSTFVQGVIGAHPRIHILDGEWASFQDPDYDEGGIPKLEKKISSLSKEKLIGIKRPNYINKLYVARRIFEHAPQAKIIAVLRNPLDRIRSAYFHQMNNGVAPFLALNAGIRALLEGKLKEKYARTEELIQLSLYADGVNAYQEIFKDNFKVFLFNQIKSDAVRIIQDSYSFLGGGHFLCPKTRAGRKAPESELCHCQSKGQCSESSHSF